MYFITNKEHLRCKLHDESSTEREIICYYGCKMHTKCGIITSIQMLYQYCKSAKKQTKVYLYGPRVQFWKM
jgi:hypothetical protein